MLIEDVIQQLNDKHYDFIVQLREYIFFVFYVMEHLIVHLSY